MVKSITFEPVFQIGAMSEGGLRIPSGKASPYYLYNPRGVYFDDKYFIISDTGNHRVLIWYGFPEENQSPDIVLGHTDFYTDSPNSSGVETGLYMPTGVVVYNDMLFVADAWNHRVLIWTDFPKENCQKADIVIGQDSFSSNSQNKGKEVSDTSLFWPYSVNVIDGNLWITDTGNRRVLGWKGIPDRNKPADILLGQDNFFTNLENRGKSVDKNTFRWCHGIDGNNERLYIADAGNHRVLGWKPIPEKDTEANILIGQKDFYSSYEYPYEKQSSRNLRFPYSISVFEKFLVVADTANNRVLIWDSLPDGVYQPADFVLGQENFEENGENRWKSVQLDTLCWPYGVYMYKDKIAIADSGNNRVVIWELKH